MPGQICTQGVGRLARYEPLIERYPVLALIGGTPLVKVPLGEELGPEVEIYAKMESFNPGGSLKDRPVFRMLAEAVLTGELTPGRTIIDSSSGNAGIAYAMIGSMMGYPVELVLPGNASLERKRRIAMHGARVITTDPMLGYDEAIREAQRRYEADPGRYFKPDQYRNDNNWLAHYHTTACEILEQTGGLLTDFVAGVGTGGTITGCARRLKESDPTIEVSCIMPESFPGIEGLKPLDSPTDWVPPIFDRSVVDRWVPVTAEDAYAVCHQLARRGLFVGMSSGAYLHGVLQVAKEKRRGRFVTILNDIGERYFSAHLWD